MSYLNRLRPQLPPQTSKAAATKETFTENAELQQEQLKLLTEDEEVPVERDKDVKYRSYLLALVNIMNRNNLYICFMQMNFRPT